MKVLLVSANTEPINMPIIPVGLGAVATATADAGHEVELVDLMGMGDTWPVIEEAISRVEPDVIGISVRNIDDQHMENARFLLDPVKAVISDCRSLLNVPIVLGGAGYSVFPVSALAYLNADLGIQGEGEMAFPALLRVMEEGADLSGVPGLHIAGSEAPARRRFVRSLDLLPLPDADLWTLPLLTTQNMWMPVQTRRGCPMGCNYCSTLHIEGSIIRKRSLKIVVDALVRLVEKGFRRFFFTDNVFNIPPTYARELCRMMAERDLDMAWRCIIYPGRLDEALVKEMAAAGCTEVSLGFESGSKRILKLMNKHFGPDEIRRASDMLAAHGIHQMGFLLLGGPGENRESVEESLVFADSLPVDAMKITTGLRIYPHTALAKQALREGKISPDDDLLHPTFYMTSGLADWLRDTVGQWMTQRPHWVR